MLNKKVDLFTADKAMSERVADFMQKKVWGITLTARYKKEVATIQAAIENLKNLDGSILGEKAHDSIETMQARIDKLHADMEKQKEEEATFSFSEADVKLYNSYKKATTEAMIHTAMCEWFKQYKLDVDGSSLLNQLVSATSGKMPENNKGVIRSGATVFNSEKRSKSNFLKVFYGELAEAMLQAGTLKATAIPEDVREFYAPKKTDKKDKKAKKGENK